MTKQELIDKLRALSPNQVVIFIEKLDIGVVNNRTMGCSHEHAIAILETMFDDSLYGHFGDEIWTTIYDLKIIEVE